MIQKTTLKFLDTLKDNNNKEWFDAHRDQYLSAKENITTFIEELLKELVKFDPGLKDITAKDCVFRIFKDVRFSKDKTPYKINLGASISSGGKKAEIAGYYIHIQPGGNSMIAGGRWMPSSDDLKAIRQEIVYNTDDFKQILNDKKFKKYFGTLDPEYRMKATPRDYPKDHPEIELLKYKSYIVFHQLTDEQVLSKDFVKYAADVCKAIYPLNQFLNTAIQ